MAKAFSELSEREILALAISLQEDDARIYGDYAERLKADYHIRKSQPVSSLPFIFKSNPDFAQFGRSTRLHRHHLGRRDKYRE
jgi:hypothetical protein